MDRAAIKAARAARSKINYARASGSVQTPCVRLRLGSLQPLQDRQTEAADTVRAAVRNGVNHETKVLPYSQEVKWVASKSFSRCCHDRKLLQSVKKACTFGTDLDNFVGLVLDKRTYWCQATVREEPTENGMQHMFATNAGTLFDLSQGHVQCVL